MKASTTALVVGLILSAHALHAQDRSRYREFRLGSNLPSVAAVAKVAATGAKTIHQRPSVIQELDWRPPYLMTGTTASQSDPVQRIVFSFYDDQLFKLVISYDRQKTNGLTDGDMIEAISTTYGAPLLQPSLQNAPAVGSPINSELGSPIAQWGDVDYAVALHRSSFASEFRVVVTSPRLEMLARVAVAEAIRLDQREAPQREIDRKEKEAETTRASQEKARLANKATFKP
jgi:hypothetical protein